MGVFLSITTILTALSMTVAEETSTIVSISEDALRIVENGDVTLVYAYDNVPRKPYVMEWRSLRGVNVLRDAPSDHLHHHGLMHAITVDDVNYWEEGATGGYQIHRAFSDMRIAPETVSFTEMLDWHGAENKDTVVEEVRTITHWRHAKCNARLLGWTSTLRLPEERESVTLSGNSYHGVGMRFPEFMDVQGRFLFADDESGGFEEGPHYLARASWCAVVSGMVDIPITVAFFDAPENPRPALWFTMTAPFAYLSATMDLHGEPMPLEKNNPVTIHYGVAVWDEVVDKAAIQVCYERWLATIR